MFELQSKWVAGVLSGRIALPTQEEMMEDVKAFSLQMEVAGWPKRYTHNFSKFQVLIPMDNHRTVEISKKPCMIRLMTLSFEIYYYYRNLQIHF